MSKKYSIGKVSEECNTSIKTLRYYDKIGLFKPEYRSSESNYRYYSKKQMTTLLVIRRLRALGFSIQEIKDIILDPNLEKLKQKIEKRYDDITSEIYLLEGKKAVCESILARISLGETVIAKHKQSQQNENFSPDIQIENIPLCSMLYSRKIMKQYHNVDVSLQRWTDIYETCTSYGIYMKSPIIVTFHTPPLNQFLMTDCDVEFGVIIESKQILVQNIANKIRQWGGILAATMYHVGKYEEIINSHVSLLQWIHKNGYEVCGPISEQFLISPLDTINENSHVTKILMPIKKI